MMLHYSPPTGATGAALAMPFGEDSYQQVNGDVRHVKSVTEAGESPTADQPPSSGDKQEQDAPTPDPQPRGGDLRESEPKEDIVTEASDESFPASDPPAWT